jgi:hypothetical protein
VVIAGTIATVRWAYYNAAGINGYQITKDPVTGEWSVTGTMLLADAFKLSRSPLLFVVKRNNREWVWPILGPMPRQAGPFAVKLGKPLEDSNAYVLSYQASGNAPH